MMEALKGVIKERNAACVIVCVQLCVTCFQACLHEEFLLVWVLGFMCTSVGLVNIEAYRGKHPHVASLRFCRHPRLNIDIKIENSSTDFPATLSHRLTTLCLHAVALIT